ITSTPLTYTLSLHDALPIFRQREEGVQQDQQEDDGEQFQHAGVTRWRPRAIPPATGAGASWRRAWESRPWAAPRGRPAIIAGPADRKSTRLNSSHVKTSYAV